MSNNPDEDKKVQEETPVVPQPATPIQPDETGAYPAVAVLGGGTIVGGPGDPHHV